MNTRLMKTYVKIALGVVMFIAIAGIGAGIYMFNMKPKDLSSAKPDYIITAFDLQKEFENNESVATAKYVNKMLEVSGEILAIKPGENNSTSISIKTGSPMSSVICTFPAVNKPENLTTGSKVTVNGTCSGYLMDVLLNNCALKK